jgi:hypothetical protein
MKATDKVKIYEEVIDLLLYPTSGKHIKHPSKHLLDEVRNLGEQYGYGATMQATSYMWAQKNKEDGLEGSEHSTGACVAIIELAREKLKEIK